MPPEDPQSKGDRFPVGAEIVLTKSLLSQKRAKIVACYWLSILTLDAQFAVPFPQLSGLQRQFRRSYLLVEC